MNPKPEQILSDLVRIDSTNPPGNETAVALYLQELFRRAGVETELIEPEKGRGSIIARIGSGAKKLLYISHSDVVPAGEGWEFEPFSGEVKDGYVRGRGSLDCKDLMTAQVCAALQLLEEKVPLNGELIIAATADEETGGALGAGYLAGQCPDKLRADYAINEGADQPISIGDKLVYFFQAGEKGAAWCTLRTHGRSGHGSVPAMAENAIVKMTRAVSRLHHYRAEVILIPEVEKLIRDIAGLCGLQTESFSPPAVDQLLDELPLAKPFVEGLRAMTRMTVSPNMIRGGTKTNIVPDYCEAEIDIRILPGQDLAYVEKELRLVIGDEPEIDFTIYREPTFSSTDNDFYRLMEETTRDLVGAEAVCLPYMSNGLTDSKFLRDIGVPAYGMGHMDKGFDQQLRTTIHGRNERIDLASLHLKTRFLKELARRYLA